MEEQSNNERAFQIYVEILRVHMMDEDPVVLTNELAEKYARRAERLVTAFNFATNNVVRSTLQQMENIKT